MNDNPRCSIENSIVSYRNPEDLKWLFEKPHKCRDSSAIYGDHLLFNTSFSCKKLYDHCKFIYVLRPPRAALNEISMMRELGYEGRFAARYYSFRLRRICEMARNTRDSLFLTWDDLASGGAFQAIEQYLGLKHQLRAKVHHFMNTFSDVFNEKLIAECEDAYERYYYFMSRLDMRRAS
jgi:hypothetical protein